MEQTRASAAQENAVDEIPTAHGTGPGGIESCRSVLINVRE